MIELTQTAVQAIKEQVSKPGKVHLRVRLQSAGCCDPVLALLIDEPAADDHRTTIDGINLLVDPQTAETCGAINIDYAEKSWAQGFIITSQKPLSEWQGMAACKITGA